MGVKERLQRLERRTGGRKPPRLVVAIAIEQPDGTYQGSDGRTYTAAELEALAAEGVRVLAVQKRRENP